MEVKSYKQRRIESGYHYAGWWVTDEQESIIRHMLKVMEDAGMVPKIEMMPRGGWRPRNEGNKIKD